MFARLGGAGVGGAEENRRGLAAVILGTVLAALYPLLAKMKLVAEGASTTFKLGAGSTFASASLSLALVGVGHLVGEVDYVQAQYANLAGRMADAARTSRASDSPCT